MRGNTERFLVLTGGPGSWQGSTRSSTLCRKLDMTDPVEAGRGVIQDQVADWRACPAVGRSPRLRGIDALLGEMRSYHLAARLRWARGFFDRGVPDVVGYLRMLGLPVPAHTDKASVFRYNRRVFIAPPWKEIFEQDRERRQDFGEAVRTYEAMVATYLSYGYDLVEIPRATVEDRVRFILQNIVIEAQPLWLYS